MALAFVACDNGNNNQTSGAADKETVAMDHDYREVDENLETLGKSTGYMITYTVSSSSTEEQTERFSVTLGMKGDIYYVKSEDGDEAYYDLSDENSAVVYAKNAGDSEWSKYSVSYEQTAKASYMSTVKSEFMSFAQAYDIFANSRATKSTATICGRTCDKYTVNYSFLAFGNISLTYEVCIDTETSVCLKLYCAGSFEGSGGAVNFECTAFDTNPTFTLPTVAEEE